MYTVLIAEDELLVRLGIASSVPWAELNMRVIAEAVDGMTAWETFQHYHPDIVIMDIRMPRMDGIGLLKKIREIDSVCSVIIVTNVEYSETLEQAKALGVSDILLKVAMRKNDISQAVIKARDRLPQDRGQTILPTEDQSVWVQFLQNQEMTLPKLREKCLSSNVDYFTPFGFILMTFMPDARLSHRLEKSLVDMFKRKIVSAGDFFVFEMDESGVALAKRNFDAKKAANLLQNMVRYISKNFQVDLRIVVSETEALGKGLKRNFGKAFHYVQKEEFFDEPILMMDHLGRIQSPRYFEMLGQLRKNQVLFRNQDEIENLISEIMELPTRISENWEKGKEYGAQILKKMGGSENIIGVHGLLGEICDCTEKMIQAQRKSIQTEVLHAIEFIEDHIAGELSIQQVSEEVGYHPAYFSNLFKRELGQSYSDFLTQVRIQRAKELLKNGMLTLQEVGEQSGFSEYSYFCTKFKKISGMTPKQWRIQYGQEN